MKALVFEGICRVVCATVPDPSIQDAGDVVIRVRAAAVCGSDLHVYRGLETGLDAGTVMGHELAGEVVEAGPPRSAARTSTSIAGWRPGSTPAR